MTFKCWQTVLLLFLLSSCSTYQKVSRENYESAGISDREKEGLVYILKKRNLHYTNDDKRYVINNFNGDEDTPYESRRMNVEDHVIIPKGAPGVCVNYQGDKLYIDFGKGLVIPFSLSSEENRPGTKVLLNGLEYSLVEKKRNALLFFEREMPDR